MRTMWAEFRAAVQAIDVAEMDRAGLAVLAGEIGASRAALDGLEARMAVGMRRLGASEASTAETLRRQTGCSAREAKHRARRAEILKKMPNVAEALSSGRLTGEHATALARAAAETSPEAVDGDLGLLAEAESVPADVASGKARDWVRRRQTDDDLQRLHQWQRRNRSLMFGAGEGGMIAGIAKFDQVSGAQFQNLVEALADRLYRADGGRDNPHARTRAQCRLDALLSLVGLEPAPPPGPEPSGATPGVQPARLGAPEPARSGGPGARSAGEPARLGAPEPARSGGPGARSAGEPARLREPAWCCRTRSLWRSGRPQRWRTRSLWRSGRPQRRRTRSLWRSGRPQRRRTRSRRSGRPQRRRTRSLWRSGRPQRWRTRSPWCSRTRSLCRSGRPWCWCRPAARSRSGPTVCDRLFLRGRVRPEGPALHRDGSGVPRHRR